MANLYSKNYTTSIKTISTLDNGSSFTYTNKKKPKTKENTSTQTYSTVMMYGNMGYEIFDPTTENTQNVTNSNKSFREADAADQVKNISKTTGMTQQNRQRIAEMNANAQERRQAYEQQRANQPSTRKDLATLQPTVYKSNKYTKASDTLTTLANQYYDKKTDAENAKTGWRLVGDIAMSIGADLGGWGWLLAGAGALSNLITGSIYGNNAQKAQKYYDNANNAANNVLQYGMSLADRDQILMSAYNNVLDTRENIRTTYGEGFERMMYNYFLAKNGVTNDTYSILNGNFRTFEQSIGNFGTSDEAGLFDALTEGDMDYFSTAYNAFSLEDIDFMKNDLTRELYNSGTAFGMQLKGYDTQVRNLLDSSLKEQTGMIMDASGNLLENNLSWRAENISSAETIGSAQASSASSGLRGGTTGNNEAIARLQSALNSIQRAAQTTIVIRGLQRNMEKEQASIASSVFNSRLNQRIMVRQANEQTTMWLGSLARGTNASGVSANEQINRAKVYKSAAENNLSELPDEAIDKLYDTLSL